MGTITGNTARTNATSKRDTESGTMNNAIDFESEVSYRTVMKIADEMLANGLITEEERDMIDTIMLAKYRPTLAMLLSGKSLM